MSIPQRSGGLDFIKILASIAIFFHHYQQLYNITFTNHINFFNGLLYWGWLVELFFIISGFVMVRYIPLICNGEVPFDTWFAQRVRRILPMLAVTVVSYAILSLVYRFIFGYDPLNINSNHSLWSVFISSLGLQAGGVFSSPNLNNPLWYLCVLLICYLVFYILCALSAKLSVKTYYLFVFMIFLGLCIQEYSISFPFFRYDTARGYRAFFTGVLLSLYINNYGITKAECVLSTAVLTLFALLLAVRPSVVLTNLQYVLTFLVYPSIIFIMETPFVKNLFRHKFWSKMSAVSFNIYVWHLPFFVAVELIMYFFGTRYDYSKLSTMYTLLVFIILFAAFSHRFIEIPLDKAVSRISQNLNDRKQIRSAGL